ncbi:MAG: acyltransferase [Clostridiales bacterium]|nr:acyltransferase [Clostridiales bacterium]
MPEFLKDLTAVGIVDQVIFYFFLVLFIWGGTNKFGRKNEINDDYTSLETMKSLRGFAAIGVILHHISQVDMFQQKGILAPFLNAGAYFVAIFFFCSGYGLIKSLDSKPDYLKGFVRKRIVKAIVLPFYVNILFYVFYNLGDALTGTNIPAERWILNLTGITMMNPFGWYPVVIALLYLVFFLSFRFIKKRPIALGIVLLFIIAMGIGFCFNGHFVWWVGKKNWWLSPAANTAPWWQQQKVFWFNGEWWVNSAPAFFTGLLFASYEKHIAGFFKKLYVVKFHVLLILTMIFYKLSAFGQTKFGYWTEYAGKGPGIEDKIKTYFCQVPLFLFLGLTIIIFLMKYHVSNPISRFFGKYSFHTYLMNLLAIGIMILIFTPQVQKTVGKFSTIVFAIGVFAFTIGLGILEQKVTGLLQKVLFKEKKKKEVAA